MVKCHMENLWSQLLLDFVICFKMWGLKLQLAILSYMDKILEVIEYDKDLYAEM